MCTDFFWWGNLLGSVHFEEQKGDEKLLFDDSWEDKLWEWDVDGTNSKLCPVAGSGICCVELSGSAITGLIIRESNWISAVIPSRFCPSFWYFYVWENSVTM